MRHSGIPLRIFAAVASLFVSPIVAVAQTNNGSTPVTAAAPGGAGEGAPATGRLVLLFGPGQVTIDATNEAILDKAARLYRVGKPIIMIVTGSSDTTGSPDLNLLLSQRRADMVARGMAERGIPSERTQILAKGVTNLPVQTESGISEQQNRRVEITWRGTSNGSGP